MGLKRGDRVRVLHPEVYAGLVGRVTRVRRPEPPVHNELVIDVRMDDDGEWYDPSARDSMFYESELVPLDAVSRLAELDS